MCIFKRVYFTVRTMKKIFLIDGFAVLYRAYYAFPEIKNKEGKNLNAVFGFIRMILKRIEKEPDYLWIAWDSKEKTFRHELAPDYKATRKKMEEDFTSQIPIIREIVDELGIFSLSVSGYEADDILASFAKKFQKKSDLEISVYSWDKDLKQILDDRIAIVDLAKDTPCLSHDFKEQFGFEPQYIVDYLALLGDAADNVKGVDGIWEKTALKLIQKYHSLENLYNAIEELSGRTKECLITKKENAFFAKKMIKLAEVDISRYEESDFSFSFNYDQYVEILCKKYGFTSLEKVLGTIKQKREKPQQMSLF